MSLKSFSSCFQVWGAASNGKFPRHQCFKMSREKLSVYLELF